VGWSAAGALDEEVAVDGGLELEDDGGGHANPLNQVYIWEASWQDLFLKPFHTVH